MIATNLRIATAPAGVAARCYRCNAEIPANSEVIQGLLLAPIGYPSLDKLGLVFDGTRNATRAAWYHLACAVDVFPEESASCLAPSFLTPHSDERARALALAQSRAKAITARSAIEPARDPLGRPRVTVKVVGNASTAQSPAWMELEALTHDFAFCSSKTEYVFEAARGAASVASITSVRDPSRPIVAAVVATMVDAPVAKTHRDKIVALRTLSASCPLVWLIGDGDAALRDERAIELRTLLGTAGFEADSALIVCSARVDTNALEQLVAALDERAAGAVTLTHEESLRALVTSVEAALSHDDRAAATRQCESLDRWLARHPIAKLPWRAAATVINASPALVKQTHDVAAQCLRVPKARDAALNILWQLRDRSSEPALSALVEELLESRSRPLASLFTKAHGLLREIAPERATALLIDAFFHGDSTKSRRRDVGALLVGSKDANVAALLSSRAKWLNSDVGREALALVALIERARAPTAQ